MVNEKNKNNRLRGDRLMAAVYRENKDKIEKVCSENGITQNQLLVEMITAMHRFEDKAESAVAN
jgi:hypothetical protein|tara:strand:- start:564 stop:755 length:192 start_codon:yes stop_codon:yes gene_type:complete